MGPPSQQHSTDHNNAAKGTEVFVGGLPRSISEEKIHKVFSACGEILEIRLMKDKIGNLKGFCFVRFATKESAARAVREKSGTVLDGKKIGVLPSSEQATLYLGSLNKAWSAEEFERIVLQVFADIESIDLPMLKDVPPGQKQRNRGFAFVKFCSHAAASRAHRVGSQPDFRLGNLHPIVQWAEEEPGNDPNELAKIKIAFVRNLPIDAEENYLKQLFEPFGQVEKVVVSKKGSAPVGFVHFAERLDLERAIMGLNEKTVQGPNGGPICKLQVEVARPMEKNKKRVRENTESTFVQDHSKLSKPNDHNSLVQREMVSVDPYEDAVLALPLAVKERLLRILRLGIATRFDIDVKSLCSLKELPEPTAIYVLDQFMLSGSTVQNKGAYLAELISRQLVDKVGSSQSQDSLSKVADTTRNEAKIFSISSRVSPHHVGSFASHAHPTAARANIYATHYSPPLSDYSLSTRTLISRPEEKGLSDYPLSSQTLIGRMDEKGLADYPLSSQTLIGRSDEKGLADYPFSNRTLLERANEKGLPDYPFSSRTLIGRADENGPTSHLVNRSLSGSWPDPGPQSTQVPRIHTLEERSLSPFEPAPGPPISYGRVGLRIEEKQPSPIQTAPNSSVSYHASLGMNLGPDVQTAGGHQESRPQMRFDPFTGEPYKFDPFTGEPIRPVNTTTRQF